MWIYFLLFVLPLIFSETLENEYQAMVAFKCGFPSLNMKNDEWVKDEGQDCLKDPEAILQYCKDIYPDLDVRNIVQMTENIPIPNWCRAGEIMCNKPISIKPYRCLVGPFQSDALLVPDGCIFDHIHDSKQCNDESDWAQKSQDSCEGRKMIRMSFAMLQPCGVDRFTGVEFVCCPIPTTKAKSREEVSLRSSTTASTTTTSTKAHANLLEKKKQPKEDKLHYVIPHQMPVVQDYFTKYLDLGNSGEKWNEHEAYLKARTDMNLRHKDKVAKMMKDWHAAKQRVEALKDIDAKASEKLNKEITQRFEKIYEAEETEADDEKRQLNVLHQQRIQSELNNKKQQALDGYLDALEDPDIQSAELLKVLRQYVKALQKDRLHSINHWRHIQATDPMLADETREHVRTHIIGIDAQLEDAMRMLDRLPKIKQKIVNQISDFLDAYHSIDSSIVDLMRVTIEEPLVEDDYNDEDEDDDNNDANDDDDYDDDEYENDDEEHIKKEDPKTATIPKNVNADTSSSDSADSGEVKTSISDKIKNKEKVKANEEPKIKSWEKVKSKDTVYRQKPVEMNHLQSNPLHAEQQTLRKSYETNAGSSFAIPLGVLVGFLTVIIVIVVGVTVMRTRAHLEGQRYSQASAVETASTPEERHVASMQANGYENPTYKYFEKNAIA